MEKRGGQRGRESQKQHVDKYFAHRVVVGVLVSLQEDVIMSREMFRAYAIVSTKRAAMSPLN
jgi:hypothetical protein